MSDASMSEIATAVGLDWIIIDAEHGHLTAGGLLLFDTTLPYPSTSMYTSIAHHADQF